VFRLFLLSLLALPLHTEISSKHTKLLFLVTYCIQAAPKFDFFLEDFDFCLDQIWVFFLFKKKVIVSGVHVSFLITSCSQADEDSDLTEKPFSEQTQG